MTYDYRALTRDATTIKLASEMMQNFMCHDCQTVPVRYVFEHGYYCEEHTGKRLARNLKGLDA